MKTRKILSLMLAVLLGVTSVSSPQSVLGSEPDDISVNLTDMDDISGIADDISTGDDLSIEPEQAEPVFDDAGDLMDINNDKDGNWLSINLASNGLITPMFDSANAPTKATFYYQVYIVKGDQKEGLHWFRRDNIENLVPLRIRQAVLTESGRLGCYIEVQNAGRFNGKYYSNEFDYTVPSNRLSKPSNIQITETGGNKWLTWDRVPGSDGYLVSFLPEGADEDQSLKYDVSQNKFDLSGIIKEYGYRKYTVSVTANSGNIKETRCSEASSAVCDLKSSVSVSIDQDEMWLAAGKKAVLTAKLTNALNNDDRTLVWLSSDSSVASVDQAGNVTGISAGTATITAETATGARSVNSCKVTVYDQITSIVLDPAAKTIGTGDEFVLKADVGAYTPTGSAVTATGSAITVTGSSLVYGPAISFTPSNDYITVTNQGDGKALVKAADSVPNGKVTSQVIVKSTDGSNRSAVCNVTIGSKAHSIAIMESSDKHTMIKGSKLVLTAKTEPADAMSTGVTWKSSDSSIAVVDQKGIVTALSAGDVVIKATDNFSGISSTYALKVIVPIKKLGLNAAAITLHVGNTFKLIPVPYPSDAAIIGNVEYAKSGDNDGCIEVAADGSVRAVKLPDGQNKAVFKVSVKAKDAAGAETTAVCNVTVVKDAVKAGKVILSAAKICMGIGTVTTIKASVIPEWADNKDINWSESGDGKVISLSKNADGSIKVKALSAGAVKVTAEAADGSGRKAVCTVIVGNPVNDVQIKNKAKINTHLAVGKGVRLGAIVTAASGKPANVSVVWTSSNPTVATVDQKGTVTAKGVGLVTITATGEVPESGTAKYDSITFDVCVPVTKVTIANKAVTIKEGKSGTLQPVIVTPADATYRSISWTSSNENVVTLAKNMTFDGEQLKFYAVGPGVAKLTGVTTDGFNRKVVVAVRVLGSMHDEDVKLSVKAPKGVTVENNGSKDVKVSGLKRKQAVALIPALTPKAADKTYTFVSSNPKVASVNRKGAVTAVGTGTATITLITSDGSYTAKCTVIIAE